MKLHVENMKEPLAFEENRKLTKLNGYAFIDSYGHCYIIAYGEGRRDLYLTLFKKYEKDIDNNKM